MQYVYALNPVCIVLIIPGHSRREVPRQGCGHELIREYNDDSSHLTYINKHVAILFQLIISGFVQFFLHTILQTSKSIGNNTMKKMLLATALALLITGCAQQTFTVPNKPAAVAPKPSPIISSFLELGRKLSMQPKFVAAQKMLLKQKPSKHS